MSEFQDLFGRDVVLTFEKSDWSPRSLRSSSKCGLADMKKELQIKNILKKTMKQQGETLASISKATGVPKSTISEWLSNRTPNPVQVAKVADHLGVSLYTLLFGVEDQQEPITKLLKEEVFSGTFEITIKKVKL